jgi:tRNA pseudouridine38-40 synthase
MSYRGTNYHGYQKQSNALSIQEITENAVSKIVNHKAWIHGCSRTDTGVHANGYCFSFETTSAIPCDRFVRAMNTLLPDDISILSCEDMPLDFHARYSATSKEYIYKLFIRKEKDPFLSDLAHHYKYRFSPEKIHISCPAFIGTHDFSAFTNNTKSEKYPNGKREDTVRTIYDFHMFEPPENEFLKIFVIRGDGFLYNMVRIIVGTALAVNEDRINPNNLPDIINTKDRSLTGMTMPACGLYLNRVIY